MDLPVTPSLNCYFLPSKNRYFVLNDFEGKWQMATGDAVELILRDLGLNNQAVRGSGSALPETKAEIRRIQREKTIDAAASLGWETEGVKRIDGQNVLVTRGATLIEPVEGTFPTIQTVLSNMLGEEQLEYFFGWLASSVKGLYGGKRMYGQAVIFAGPKNCGKSLVQDQIITPLFGGRVAKPYEWLAGLTQFNSELFEAVHQKIEDEYHLGDYKNRKAFGAAIKRMTANNTQKLHEKGLPAFSTQPYWRLSISLNDEYDNIAVLPSMEDSLGDKMLIFKCESHPMPVKDLDGVFKRELPALLFHLLNSHVIPESHASDRYPVKGYINPDIEAALDDVGEEWPLFEFFEKLYQGKKVEWSSSQLAHALESENAPKSFERFIRYPNQIGSALAKIARKDKRVYQQEKRISNKRPWVFDFTEQK